ncbi:hypothetical protein [Bacillus badius]|uniref:Competence protein n=1 Tax=Bacillus badius TaxID=1455 RepID=A0ABR5AVX6_BACBA|nr:hypothetical protein [Bacillus badius]KIL74418.1 hypothetical protein SD78_1487 [Bacillus badius]KIL78889.1 hypothetical protein SD77_3690 [Bacillus badius]MED0665797.1 hypothetical protein [Bacillus badius]MED4717409.1 hypothetical protein [Bacillus badius]TDW03294.1 hypothetical protein B0G66_104202 [Bacillus badius]
MGKRSKSKRFVKQGTDSVSQHAERFPYRTTYSEAEERRFSTENTADNPDLTLGGV